MAVVIRAALAVLNADSWRPVVAVGGVRGSEMRGVRVLRVLLLHRSDRAVQPPLITLLLIRS